MEVIMRSLRIALLALGLIGCGNDSSPGSGPSGEIPQQDVCANSFASHAADPFTDPMTATGKAGVTVSLESNPPMPALGDRHTTFKMTITDASGNPVPDGTTVAAKCTMTHSSYSHGCAVTPVVKELGGGVYQASPVIFNMQGIWAFTVTVGSLDVVNYSFCLQ
jgi:hypothetical protein